MKMENKDIKPRLLYKPHEKQEWCVFFTTVALASSTVLC